MYDNTKMTNKEMEEYILRKELLENSAEHYNNGAKCSTTDMFSETQRQINGFVDHI